MTLFFDDLSFCQNVRFRPLCLPYSSVVPALMDFIRFSRGWVLPFCQGGVGFCFPFAVCGVRVCAGGPPACQVTVLLGALWLFKMCPVFLSDKSGMRFLRGGRGPDACFFPFSAVPFSVPGQSSPFCVPNVKPFASD